MNTTVVVTIALPLICFWLEVVVTVAMEHLACRNNRPSSTSSRRLFPSIRDGDGRKYSNSNSGSAN